MISKVISRQIIKINLIQNEPFVSVINLQIKLEQVNVIVAIDYVTRSVCL